jgi:hypothetical protein
VIGLTAAVVAGTGVTALLVVPHLTGSAAATGTPGPSADPSLFGLAAVFTPPTEAEQWQEATSVAFSTNGKTLAVGLTTGSDERVQREHVPRRDLPVQRGLR